MSVTVTHNLLSALNPVEVSYSYNAEEALKGNFCLYDFGLRTYNYELFKNFKDAAFSKKTALVLTDIKDLKNVFETTIDTIDIGNIAGNCYLQVENNDTLDGDTYIKLYKNELWVGGKGEKAMFTIIPLSQNLAQLKVKNFYVQVAASYPYKIELSLVKLEESENYRQQFYVDFNKNNITFKAVTQDGYRYIGYNSVDRALYCNGVQLNSTIISQYLFSTTFMSSATIPYGYDPTVKEIKYYNSIESGELQKSVTVSHKQTANTNLLVTLPSYSLLDKSSVNANIMLLKTNFSTIGTFNSSIEQ